MLELIKLMESYKKYDVPVIEILTDIDTEAEIILDSSKRCD